MRVRALLQGYYGHKRRKPGEVFDLVAGKLKSGADYPVEAQFSAKWMEKVEGHSSKSKKSDSKSKAEPLANFATGDAEVI